MNPELVLGIDPGARGALAFLNLSVGALEVYEMPTVAVERNGKAKHEISPQMIAAILHGSQRPGVAIIERVGAMPGQGVSSMFQFGRGVGMLEGVLAALSIPITYIAPQVWRKAVALRGGKDASRLRATELFPAMARKFTRVKDDGNAEAALIAYWGACHNSATIRS